MTVRELIERLEEIENQDMEVIAGFEPIANIETLEDYCTYGNTVISIN